MMCKWLIFSILVLLLPAKASAQYFLLDESYTAQQLAETIFGTNCAPQISNAVLTGNNSHGYFTLNFATTPDYPFTSGILLTTGTAATAVGPPDIDVSSEGDATWPGDTDFQNAFGVSPSYNATVLEFDFVPVTDEITIDYCFASEEYFDVTWRGCDYKDGIAILIKPLGSADPYQNIALLPDNSTVGNTTISYNYSCENGILYWYYLQGNGLYHYPLAYSDDTSVFTAAANVVAGTAYHMKIVIADGGDTGYDSAVLIGEQTQDFSIDLGDDRLLAVYTPLCAGEILTLTSVPGGTSYEWYQDGTLLPAEITDTYTVTAPGDYTSIVHLATGCVRTGSILIEYDQPIPQTSLTYYQCDDDADGLAPFYIAQVGQEVLSPISLQPIYYYASLADANNGISMTISAQPVPFYNTTPNQVIYALAQNQYGCRALIPITLSTLQSAAISLPPVAACPEEGADDSFAQFDLLQASATVVQGLPPDVTAQFFATEADALAGTPQLPDDFTNTVAGGQTIYVRFSSSQGCYGIAPLQLVVQDFGAGMADEALALCKDRTLDLDAGDGFTAYAWQTTPVQTTRLITVEAPGDYSVTVTNSAGCTRTKTFTVFESEVAEGAVFTINDFMGGSNSVAIAAQGNGTYEYSLNGGTYQESPVFDNLPPGEYTAYIRDVNGCGIYTDTFFILDYPTFFTPDDDGLNDVWYIPYLQKRPQILVTVYNRYGKLITSFKGISGWDGTLSGIRLPATDYWFSLVLENGREVKGHFALLR